MSQVIVDSDAYSLREIFSEKYGIDFYQREYVWQRKQLEDLISDLSTEFLKNWRPADPLAKGKDYDPYFMGELVVSNQTGKLNAVIDGQQRITTFSLLLIYLLNTYKAELGDLASELAEMVYSDDWGTPRFTLDIIERRECMYALFKQGAYMPVADDEPSVITIVDRYEDIADCWDDRINEENIVPFTYWLKEKVIFSKVWTNSDDFAYVIFETMNDRGLSLTQVEMLRSYLLANISPEYRESSLEKYDGMIKRLTTISLPSKSKAEIEFFKIFFRGHLAEDLSQSRNARSDFQRIGSEFHRWVRDESDKLGLTESSDYVAFIDQLCYFADAYVLINSLISSRNTNEYLYLIVNSDYGFTLQPALILASIAYNDSGDTVKKKIGLVSRYLTKVLTWRVWNHWVISQSSMEAQIYELCKQIRNMDVTELEEYLKSNPTDIPALENSPTLNQQNKKKLRVLISLITEIVAVESGTPDYALNRKDMEVEHIWSDHFERHTDDCDSTDEFSRVRNNIGDLLVLPKSFNASYGDDPFEDKVVHYLEHNILAQSLNASKYSNNPGFLQFKARSGLAFESYEHFNRSEIAKRAELYKSILLWNWPE